MIRLINLVLLVSLPFVSFAQDKCNCPENYSYKEVSKKIFHFKNGEVFGLCGWTEDNGTTYSEFAIFNCKSNKIIDEWGAVKTCRVKFNHDTLMVSELFQFPIGKTLQYKDAAFYVHKFYFVANNLKKLSKYNKNVVHYDQSQIQTALTKFKTAKAGNTEKNIEVADMLFCASVSGNKQAEESFKQVPKKLGPFDGHISEEWHSLLDLYLNYKSQTDKSVESEVQ
jgi:hypothetical protein